MALRNHPLELTGSDQAVFTVPSQTQATAHSIMITGSGNLTLKLYSARDDQTYTIYDSLEVTDEKVIEKALNFEPGDQLIASDDDSGMRLFASVYYVSADQSSEQLPFGPGPQELQAGDMSAGFFGEVESEDLFSGADLAAALAVTEGTSQHSTAGWLKFAFQGDIIYVAKRPFRHSISWDHLYERGIVYGTDDEGVAPRGTPTNQLTKVDKGPYSFICRLLTGANADPFDDSDPLYREDGMCALNLGEGSEWNELIYRIHEDVPDCPDTIGMLVNRHGGAQDGSNWADYTDSDLVIGGGNGRFTWCQEAEGSTGSSGRLGRGYTDVALFYRITASLTPSDCGWRPALVLSTNH